MIILLFLILHWYLSLFGQTFFLHRYSAHKMFTMNKFWEKFFYVFSWIAQGSSYLNARAYAILHRMHHAYSDTEKDPHTPHFLRIQHIFRKQHSFSIHHRFPCTTHVFGVPHICLYTSFFRPDVRYKA